MIVQMVSFQMVIFCVKNIVNFVLDMVCQFCDLFQFEILEMDVEFLYFY